MSWQLMRITNLDQFFSSNWTARWPDFNPLDFSHKSKF